MAVMSHCYDRTPERVNSRPAICAHRGAVSAPARTQVAVRRAYRSGKTILMSSSRVAAPVLAIAR